MTKTDTKPDMALGRDSGAVDRRSFLRGALAVGVTTGLGCPAGGQRANPAGDPTPGPAGAPAIVCSEGSRPAVTYGVQSGDIAHDRAVLWAATDRPARMILELSQSDRFTDVRRIVGPAALADSGFSAKQLITGLPADQHVFYRVRFQDLCDLKTLSQPITGHFRTAPGPGAPLRSIRFLWSGDTAGQGWGINPELGGMTTYRTMLGREPDFFIHSGDTIYADGPIEAEVKLDDGSIWRNLTLEGTHKVAETMAEFRANFRYNLLDEHVRAFNAQVPQFMQWDDHETTNNWYPGEILRDDSRYTVKSAALLSARARRAFLEWTPIATMPSDPERIYRKFSYGPLLDIFMLDMRSYRGPNSGNRQSTAGPEIAFLGAAQLAWLEQSLAASTARWKIIASDMPLGLIVEDGDDGEHFENSSNGDGPPLGRELEIAGLLSAIKRRSIRNVVWLTADVHYTAAHRYDPGRAKFSDFDPFWEFVSGPLHAGTFGPSALDDTFGPQVVFQKAPPPGQANLPPSAGLQFFGEVVIDSKTQAMTVMLKDLTGATLYSVEIPAAV